MILLHSFKHYTPCLRKKLCQIISCSLSVNYEPISIKIGRTVPDQTHNKTVPKMLTSPKSMCLHYLEKFKASD